MIFKSPINIVAYTAKPSANPRTGHFFMYPKVDGKLYLLDSEGNEVSSTAEFTISGNSGELVITGTKAFNIIGDGPTSVDIVDDTITISTDSYTKEESDSNLASATKVHASVLTQSELDIEIPNPEIGMVAIVGNTMKRYEGTGWIDIYEDYLKTGDFKQNSDIIVFPDSSVYFLIDSIYYNSITSIFHRYLSRRGTNARAGTIELLGDSITFQFTEDYQQTEDIGLTVSFEEVSIDKYIKFTLDNSSVDQCTIRIVKTIADAIQI